MERERGQGSGRAWQTMGGRDLRATAGRKWGLGAARSPGPGQGSWRSDPWPQTWAATEGKRLGASRTGGLKTGRMEGRFTEAAKRAGRALGVWGAGGWEQKPHWDPVELETGGGGWGGALRSQRPQWQRWGLRAEATRSRPGAPSPRLFADP